MKNESRLALIVGLALALIMPVLNAAVGLSQVRVRGAAQQTQYVGCWAHLASARKEQAQKGWEHSVSLPWVGDPFNRKFGSHSYTLQHFDATPNESTDGSWKIMDNGNGTITLKIFPGFVPPGALRPTDPTQFVYQERTSGYKRGRRVKANQVEGGGVTYTFIPTSNHPELPVSQGEWSSIETAIN